jgi:2-keto-4-pentenoate hydratase/2-oxohepta-3-ene-1,7-dioic acid hydratase in catechol pathway
MRFASYDDGAGPRIGVVADGELATTRFGSLQELIEAGDGGLAEARQALEIGNRVQPEQLLPPVRPRQVICCGINYASHLEENPGAQVPARPFLFAKLPSSVIGPGDPIVIPAPESEVDYEVELTAVIGKTMRRVPRHEVLDYVFGYTVVNDVSGRDIQFVDQQITLGKSIDSFCPVGPVVTAAEGFDPGAAELTTHINGERRQHDSTANQFFDLPTLLEHVSRYITLQPGDLVTTGTPAGVGAFRDPPAYLRPGDVVTVAVEGIGELTNPVVAGWA